MSTWERYQQSELVKATIESAFYGNNVHEVKSVAEVYELAKQLVYNHGNILGRMASARHFVDDPEEDAAALTNSLYEDIYAGHEQKYLKPTVLVGLDPSFSLKAHLMLPEDQAFNLLSYMLNFRFFDEKAAEMYGKSKLYDEGDLYFYFDPNVTDPAYPNGLAIFDAPHNCAAVFGLRYFGELKKGTLTLAWALAHRHGYTACHGGEQAFHFEDKKDKVFAFYGLSDSSKSTLTHADHDGKYDITVLHDDACIISREDGSSVALEPAYFDKTHDYPAGHHETKYYTTVMNCAVTLDEAGRKVLVTEDLRKNNGRVIKSRYTSANRVDAEENPITALFWIMKDNSLPPVLKVTDPVLATTLGLTLATKRTSAENLPKGFDINTLVIIPKELTLEIIEKLVDDTDQWQAFGDFAGVSYMPLADYPVDLEYKQNLRARMQDRLDWLNMYNGEHPKTPLPEEAKECLEKIVSELK